MQKNFLPAFVLSLLLIPSVFAEDDMSCVEKTQAAVAPNGECQEFPTPCDVPSDWKHVPSCENVKDMNFGLTPEDATERRYKLKMQALSRKTSNTKNLEERVSAKYRRLGGGSFTRSTKNPSLSRKVGAQSSDRNSTTKNYDDTKAYDLYKTLNSKRKYNTERVEVIEQEKEMSEESDITNPTRPGIQSSVSDVFRQGPLTNAQKWNLQQKGRVRKTITGKNPYSLQSKIKRVPKRRVYEGPKLKQIYKGELLQGDLNN